MTSRKYSFNHLSAEQLEKIAAKYPKAVQTVTTRKPVYKVLAMLAECGVEMPDDISLVDDTPPGLKDKKAG